MNVKLAEQITPDQGPLTSIIHFEREIGSKPLLSEITQCDQFSKDADRVPSLQGAGDLSNGYRTVAKARCQRHNTTTSQQSGRDIDLNRRSAMKRQMANSAQPHDIERLRVIFVVLFSASTAAFSTGLRNQAATPLIDVCITARVIFEFLLGRHRVRLAPIPHIGRATFQAVALRKTFAFAVAATAWRVC